MSAAVQPSPLPPQPPARTNGRGETSEGVGGAAMTKATTSGSSASASVVGTSSSANARNVLTRAQARRRQPHQQQSRQQPHQPDWNAFYKNGVPKEVIVISDDEEDSFHDTNDRFESRYSSSNGSKRNRESTRSESLSEISVLECVPSSTTATTSHSHSTRGGHFSLFSGANYYLGGPHSPHSYHDYPNDARYPSSSSHGGAHHYNLNPSEKIQNQGPIAESSAAIARTSQLASVKYGAPLQTLTSATTATTTTTATATMTKRKRRRRGSPSMDGEVSAITTIINNKTSRTETIRDYIPPPKPIHKAKEVYVPSIREKIRPATSSYDDADGHYLVSVGSVLADRFHIRKLLGQGTFGKVVAAYDRKRKIECAIKIIRSVQKYRDASRIELRVLQTLSMYDRHNVHRCIQLRECFDFRNHICIVTDLLGISVYDFTKANKFLPFPGSQVQSFARQLFRSVAFLHDLGLIHTDLKPENILLESSDSVIRPYKRSSVDKKVWNRKVLKSTAIHLIDFGSAIFDDEYHSSVVSTRHYRAPEIILGIGWSFPCDIWSIGCILIELCTGEALFQTHDNVEHLALMQKVLGQKVDAKIIEKIDWNMPGYEYFDMTTKTLKYPGADTEEQSVEYVEQVKTFDQMIKATSTFKENRRFWLLFLDLLHRIFVYDPKKRISAKSALLHPWFDEKVVDDGVMN